MFPKLLPTVECLIATITLVSVRGTGSRTRCTATFVLMNTPVNSMEKKISKLKEKTKKWHFTFYLRTSLSTLFPAYNKVNRRNRMMSKHSILRIINNNVKYEDNRDSKVMRPSWRRCTLTVNSISTQSNELFWFPCSGNTTNRGVDMQYKMSWNASFYQVLYELYPVKQKSALL